MVALIRVSTQEIIQDFGNTVPDFISVPRIGKVHCVKPTWSIEDYQLVNVVNEGIPESQFSTVISVTQTLSNNTLTITTTYNNPSLGEIQANLCSQVDNKAEDVRLLYITPGAGQASVYIMKYNEALDIVANTAAQPSDYPLNAASIGVQGISTIQDAASWTIETAQRWFPIAAAIENIRLQGKNNINVANSINNAIAAFSAINWAAVGG